MNAFRQGADLPGSLSSLPAGPHRNGCLPRGPRRTKALGRERGREGDLCGGFPLSQKAPPGTFPLTFRHGYQETNPFFSLSFSSTIRWLNPVMWTSEQDT